MASPSYDVLVIGGGHNGLVAAAYLARAGRKVLVLERRPVLGGAAVSEEVFPGFTTSVCSYVVSLLRPEIIRELDLPRHGLDLLPLESTITPLEGGRYLLRNGDAEATRREIARFSAADAERLPEFGRLMTRLSRFVRPLLGTIPPDPTRWRGLLELAGIARSGSRLAPRDRAELARLASMSAVDFLSRFFESPELIGAMSVSGIIGTFLGVRSPGTAYVLLHHYMGEIDGAFRAWGLPVGGTGAVSNAIADAARAHGAEIRTEAEVDRILVQRGRARGVVLAGSGEEITARVVVSGADPRRTLLGMVGADSLPEELVASLERFKFRGSSAKVNLALDGVPELACLPGIGDHLKGDITIAPSIDYLERAYDEAKYGDFSKRPFLDVVIPSLSDPTVAPPGKHTMSIFVQYAPYELAEGSWDAKRDALGDAVIETLAEHMPSLPDRILHRQVLTPLDLEREIGLTEGNIFHGELSQEQLFLLRPAPGWAEHRTPIRGLWMAGSGTHPGGGIMGAPGRNCAGAIIARGGRA